MSVQTWKETLYSSVTDAVQISNTVTETIMIPDTAIPARYWYSGRTLKYVLRGALSNVITTPGTLTLRARLGGVAGTLIVASAALTLNVAAQTNSQVNIEFMLVCRAAGWSATSGTLFATGQANLGLSAATQGRVDMIPASAPAPVTTIDLTSASIVSLTAQFSVATAPTNLLINHATIESSN